MWNTIPAVTLNKKRIIFIFYTYVVTFVMLEDKKILPSNPYVSKFFKHSLTLGY